MAQDQIIEILPPEAQIAVYEPHRAVLLALKDEAANMIFDYESKKGNESARSYIHKLRRSKTPIVDAHKAAKAESLEYGRKLDAGKNALIAAIDEMIAPHQAAVDEIEERERKRVADIHQAINTFASIANPDPGYDSAFLRVRLEMVEQVAIDDSFAEFYVDAKNEKTAAIEKLTAMIAETELREKEAAELSRLRKMMEEREAKEAAEQAEREAEERAARKVEAERQAEVARIQLEADQKVAQAQREAAEIERKAEAEKKAVAAKAAEDARREADKAHQRTIHNEIIEAMLAVGGTATEMGMTAAQAKAIIIAIRKGEIPHLAIKY